ncbi:hypothetical protein [Fischerella muscicola]
MAKWQLNKFHAIYHVMKRSSEMAAQAQTSFHKHDLFMLWNF